MNISSFQIQNVIKAYGQRVERRGIAKLKRSGGTVTPDRISISSEAKKRQVLNKVVDSIIEKAKFTSSREIDREALIEKLGERLGGKIDIVDSKDKRGFAIRFKVFDEEKGEIIKELRPEEDLKDLMESVYSKIG